MRNLSLILLLFLYHSTYSQIAKSDLPTGHWVLSEHFVFDSELNVSVNIYEGQMNQSIEFYEDGSLSLTLDDGRELPGTWGISKKGMFSIKQWDDEGLGYMKNVEHNFGSGVIVIPWDYLYGLYETEEDSLNGGHSIYKRISDSIYLSEDSKLAEQYFQSGLSTLKENPDDVGGKAVEAFRKANQLRADYYWEAYYWIARYTYFRDENAIDVISTAIKLNPKNADLYVERSNIKLFRKDKDGALGDLNMALIYSPEDPNVFIQRAKLLRDQLHLYKEAKKDCSRAIELDTNNSSAYFERAIINVKLDLEEEACQDFIKAKELGYSGWNIHMKDCDLNNEE